MHQMRICNRVVVLLPNKILFNSNPRGCQEMGHSGAITAKNVYNSWRNLVIIYTTLCGFAFIASNQHKFQHFYTFLFSIVSCISLVISDWNFFLQMLNRLDLFPDLFSIWKKCVMSNFFLLYLYDVHVHLRCHLNMFGWVNLSVVVSFEQGKNKRNGKQCDNEIPSVDHQLIEEFWGLVASVR